jgi:hypothetical protein
MNGRLPAAAGKRFPADALTKTQIAHTSPMVAEERLI